MFRYLLFLSFIKFSFYSVAVAGNCDAIETIEGQEKYNDLVCAGIRYFQVGLYQKAINQYKEALKIRFLDVPNYRLNARLAHAYLLIGDTKNAVYYTKKSELTLSLLSGIYSCEEDENSLHFISKDGKYRLDSSLAREVTLDMCGGAYDYIYNARFKNLSAVLHEGMLVKYHLLVTELVDSRIVLTAQQKVDK